MSTDTAPKYPELYDELAAIMAASLVEEGVTTPDDARRAARRFVERLRRSPLAGQKHYFPRGKLIDVEEMRQEIGRRWDGRNTRELCNEFDISETWLRELHEQAHGRTRVTG